MKEFKGFTKGVNLGGWLSQCDYSDDRLNNFITEEDIKKIASWGMDHVRIPIDYNVIQNNDGTSKTEGYKHIDRGLEMCEKYGLNTVLDLHKTMGYSFDKGEQEIGFFDNDTYHEYFYKLWEKMARRYGNDEHIAFELLNEVTDQAYSKKWNAIAENCIKRIRAIADKTVILVGSYWNNSIDAVKDLDKPFDDRVVYNFHCYDPLPFTHQGASWVDFADCSKTVSYKESGVSAEAFTNKFKEAFKKAEENGTVLYCGEYGVIDRVSPQDTLSWFKDINAAFNEYGISRCAWSYKEMDFGLSDERLKGVIDELIKHL